MIDVQKRHCATPRPFGGLSEVQRAGLIEEREGWRGQSEVRERDFGNWDLGEREMKGDCGQNSKRKVIKGRVGGSGGSFGSPQRIPVMSCFCERGLLPLGNLIDSTTRVSTYLYHACRLNSRIYFLL